MQDDDSATADGVDPLGGADPLGTDTELAIDVPEPGSGLDRKKQIIGGIITIAVLAFVFLGIFPKFADYQSAWEAIQAMSITALVGLVIVTLINITVYVLPYQAALPGIRYWPAFVVRQTSFMISNAIPAGGAFGLGIQYAMLSGYRFNPSETTTAIAATSLWNLMVTLGLPVFGLAILAVTGEATSQLTIAAILGVLLLGAMILAIAVVVKNEKWAVRIGGWGDSLMHRFRPHAEENVATREIVKLRNTIAGLVTTGWLKLTWTSVLQQLLQFSILAAAFYAITGSDGGLNLVELFAAFSMARLAGFIPVTPGGLGTVDAALVALMVTMGADEDQALAADLVWRALSYFPQVFLGIFTFLYWRHGQSKGGSSGASRSPSADEGSGATV